ncbi:MAG: hypothetical protein FJX60_15200 [Alphaproteobacteria bacterium]|nr:hypothetical protein [Alphaproteobacteria bacterium]
MPIPRARRRFPRLSSSRLRRCRSARPPAPMPPTTARATRRAARSTAMTTKAERAGARSGKREERAATPRQRATPAIPRRLPETPAEIGRRRLSPMQPSRQRPRRAQHPPQLPPRGPQSWRRLCGPSCLEPVRRPRRCSAWPRARWW